MTTDPTSSPALGGLLIHTPRLSIRPLQLDDVEAMHAIYSDVEATRFIPGGVRDYAGTHQRVTDLIGHQHRYGVSKWAVTLAESGVLIGDCGLRPVVL
jgi:RimJ/RimL family protein N-acetyltransferase